MDRRPSMLDGIAALRDATRVLRGHGAARRDTATERERGALIDLSGLADRLEAFADDQREDDWAQFWVTERDVQKLRRHVDALGVDAHLLNRVTVQELQALIVTLSAMVQAPANVTD